LRQTQLELSIYRWPQWPLQDALRRERAADLGPAIEDYRSALMLDARNATANRRLGQIELALGQYDAACSHLSAAYAAAPNQRATRQLLGECYALSEDVAQTVGLWRTIDVSQGQLALRTWWYANYLEDNVHARRLAQAIQALDKP
jgi:tetratricopeptide (TPR) repeat protein